MSYPIRPQMKEAWNRAIAFIAYNDDDGAPDALDFRQVCSYISVILTAETFHVHVEKVARAVLKLRRAAKKRELSSPN